MPISGADIASSNAHTALDKIKALEQRVAELERIVTDLRYAVECLKPN